MAGQNRAGWDAIERILPDVQKPFRYIGGEWNQVVKSHDDVEVTFALAFPDLYEIGMSHLGFRILYALLNERNDTAAERVFCPWPDMADALRERSLPLTSLETHSPIGEFDIVGFSLQYEMTFTNILEMLDLAGIPLRAEERGEGDPLILAGGPAAFNPEPLADFVDLVFVGDGEEAVPEFIELLKEHKSSGAPRAERIRQAAGIAGIYAPSLYDVERDGLNGMLIPVAAGEAPCPVERRVLFDLDRFPFPERIIVPHGEIVHDRVSIEVMRGCPIGCRFCQAGYAYRPTRQRDPNRVRNAAVGSVRATGYDQFSLSSLNTGEYGAIHEVIDELMGRFEGEKVSISLSSMHASTITPEMAEQVRKVRKSGFTIAPEAGSQRLREVINKNLDERQILTACELAFEAGWEQIKLYFMIGLPTERDEDIDGIVDLAHDIAGIAKRSGRRRRREAVTVSASSFVPKPGTPFQWVAMEREEELRRKQDMIAKGLRRGVRFKRHDRAISTLEAVFSKGDRALCPVLERAWRNGARFDGWEELHDGAAWKRAFADEGIDPAFYSHRELDPEGRLPWDVLDTGVNRRWLAAEYRRALEGKSVPACGADECHGCGSFAKECVDGVVAASMKKRLDPTPVEHAAAARPADSPRYRYRARFTKGGLLRFLGHLDIMRLIIRALRRAGIEMVYSQGFNPKPKLSFGPALPVGVSSEGEYADFESYDRLEPSETLRRLNGALPDGVRFEAVRMIRRGLPALTEAVRAARYRVHTGCGRDLAGELDSFRARRGVTVSRTKKNGREHSFLLDEEVLELKQLDGDSLSMTLALRGGGASVRPGEVLQGIFGAAARSFTLVREQLLVDWKGRLVDPMLAASAADG
jgi:radical SAM family uncharacterized protein/radical SAM-linked protein